MYNQKKGYSDFIWYVSFWAEGSRIKKLEKIFKIDQDKHCEEFFI